MQKNNSPSKFDMECTKKLLVTLKKYKRIKRDFSIQRSDEQFRLLREKDKNTKQAIQLVLNWYCKINVKEPVYHFCCYSGQSFRYKFDRMKENIQMDQKVPSSVKLTKTQKEIHKDITAQDWPSSVSEQEIKYCLKHSHKNIKRMLKKINKRSRNTKSKHGDACCHLMVHHFGNADSYIYDWMMKVFDNVKNWQDFSGQLKGFICSPNCKLFEMQITFILSEFGTGTNWFDIKNIIEEKK